MDEMRSEGEGCVKNNFKVLKQNINNNFMVFKLTVKEIPLKYLLSYT